MYRIIELKLKLVSVLCFWKQWKVIGPITGGRVLEASECLVLFQDI